MQKLIYLFGIAWQFIKSNKTRFFIEVAVALLTAAVGYGTNHFFGRRELQACQDERQALLQETRQNQAALEAVKYAGIIAGYQTQILKLNETILNQREKMAADSIRNLTHLEAMRAINEYIRQHPSSTGVRPKR